MNKDITINEFDANKQILLDIRTPAEQQIATVENSVLFPMNYSSLDVHGLEDFIKNSAKECVLMCHSGARSRRACDILAVRGVACKNLQGGISEIAFTKPEIIKEH